MSLRSVASWSALLAVALLFVPFAFARAQAPQIAIAGGPVERPIVLQSVRVDAEIAGSVALTRVEMVFFNPNRRVLEGELQFPLLDGQAITRLAPGLDGQLRDAVPGGKARGRARVEDAPP